MNTIAFVSDLIRDVKNKSSLEGFRVEDKNVFRASSVWKCPRALYYQAIDPAFPQKLIENEGFAVIPGTAAHEFFQSRLSRITPAFEHEIPVKINYGSIKITGHVDSLIGLNEDRSFEHYLNADCVVLIDYKTTKSVKYCKETPSHHHFAQINMYAYAISQIVGHSNIYCHVVNLDKQDYQHVIQDWRYDDKSAIKTLEKLNSLFLEHIQPMKLPDTAPAENWECRYCDHVEKCKKEGGSIWK